MAVGAAFRANSHDDKQLFPSWTSPHAINLREHRNIKNSGATQAARKLQVAGLIEYHRGRITVLDRAGLEARACECYAAGKKEFDRLLPEVGVR